MPSVSVANSNECPKIVKGPCGTVPVDQFILKTRLLHCGRDHGRWKPSAVALFELVRRKVILRTGGNTTGRVRVGAVAHGGALPVGEVFAAVEVVDKRHVGPAWRCDRQAPGDKFN